MTLIIIVNTRMSMSVVPLLRTIKDKGVTFVMSHTKLARGQETGLLKRTEGLARVSMTFDLDQVEVKVNSSGPMADIRRTLRMLDPEVRMEVFSLTSEQEHDHLVIRQRSNRAILIYNFCRPWTEPELVRHLSSFGHLEELHSYHCQTSAKQHNVLVMFKSTDAKNSCIEAALCHKQFLVQPFEDINLECDGLNLSSEVSRQSHKSRSVSPSLIPIDSSDSVGRSGYFSYNYFKTKLQRQSQLIYNTGLTQRLERSKHKEAASLANINSKISCRSNSADCKRLALLEGTQIENSYRSISCAKIIDNGYLPDKVARSMCPFDTADLDRSFLSFCSNDDKLYRSKGTRLVNTQSAARLTGGGDPRPSLPRCFAQSSPAVPLLELYSVSKGGQESFGCRQVERQCVNMFYTQPHIPYFAFPNEIITQSHSQA